MPGTILYVAHSFPPASGSGANRALAFARYLPVFGWRPVVLTPGAAWAANRDDALAAEIPRGLAVDRTGSWEPRPPGRPVPAGGPTVLAGGRGVLAEPQWASCAVLRGLSTWAEEWHGFAPMRSTGFAGLKSHAAHARRFPDAHLGWLPFAVRAGLRAVREHRAAVLYSTAGPFTCHLVGLALHRATGRPWVAELRDGWYRWNQAIFPDYPFWRHWIEGPLERAVVESADRVVLVTDQMAEAFRAQYRHLPAAHFQTIPNGFDPSQYASPGGAPALEAAFEVLHAGALYRGRSIGAFLEAAGRLAAGNVEFARQFRLRLVGSLDEGTRAEVARQVERHGLGSHVAYFGYLTHRATLAALRSASLLLLVVNTTPGAEATVPGKLFEYLAARRPILAIAPPGAEAAEIIRRTRAGWVAPAHDPAGILDRLRAAFDAHRQRTVFAPRGEEVARYDRRRLACDLARLLDDVQAEAGPSDP